MNKFEKGDYGYMKSYRFSKLIITLILALMIAFIVITMLIIYGDTSRVMIVFAILLALPFAKFLISYILCANFKPLTQEEYEKIRDEGGDNSNSLMYDVVISQYEGMKFYQSMCVKNGKVYALVLDKKYEENKKDYEKWIHACVDDSKYKYGVTVFNNIDAYIKKIKSVSTPNDKTRIVDKHMAERILDTCV